MASQHTDSHINFLSPSERTPLISRRMTFSEEQRSISAWTRESHAIASTAVGERLPYSDYTSIDWLHETV
jgi:chloride channel 3/4/5